MKKTIILITVLMLITALFLTACTDVSGIKKAEKNNNSYTSILNDTPEFHDLETDDLGAEGIVQETAEYSSDIDIQKEADLSESPLDPTTEPGEKKPSWYLKDKLTAVGSLGEDYPLISGYGPRDDYGGQISADHKGMDFAMDEGTELISPGECRVAYTGYNDARGFWVVLYWGHGYYIILQHLSALIAETGCILGEGDLVALSGDTGASMMPHLHVEILQDESGQDTMESFGDGTRCVNPYYFIFGTEDVS